MKRDGVSNRYLVIGEGVTICYPVIFSKGVGKMPTPFALECGESDLLTPLRVSLDGVTVSVTPFVQRKYKYKLFYPLNIQALYLRYPAVFQVLLFSPCSY